MRSVLSRWRQLLKIRWLMLFAVASVLAVASSLKLQAVTARYADRTAAFPVPDLLLDRLPLVNLDWFVVWGYLFLVLAAIVAIAFLEPENLPFALISFSLFVFVRAIFVTLTHLAPPADANPPDYYFRIVQNLASQNDLFFSGHTGFPFLVFLVMRQRRIRYFFLASSFVMGAAVLLAHLHYSIDVFAAFFITYTTYKISERLFGRWRLERSVTELPSY